MKFNHFLYVSQAKSEAFDVVLVACVNTIELVEDAFEVVFPDADAVVGNAYAEVRLALIEGVNLDGKRLVFSAILESVVEQVEDDVCEVHLVGIDEGVVGFELHVERAANLCHLEREGIDDVFRYLVRVELLHLQCNVVVVEEAHLQNFLYLIAQASCLARDDATQSFVSLLALVHGLVRKHDQNDRCAVERAS